jgi:hypothetical protein
LIFPLDNKDFERKDRKENAAKIAKKIQISSAQFPFVLLRIAKIVVVEW